MIFRVWNTNISLFNVYRNQGNNIPEGQKNDLYSWLIAENIGYFFNQPLNYATQGYYINI